FSSHELCAIAEIDRKLANLWLERGVIQPSRIEQLAVRSRPYFSCVAIFKARLTRELSEPIGLATSRIAALGAEAADNRAAYSSDIRRVVDVAANEGWMYGAARAAERGKPFGLYAGLGRSKKCWEFRMDTDVRTLAEYFRDMAFVAIPIETIFYSVYLKCKLVFEGRSD